ncbi:glycosyltransferase family 8 protein [Nostoc sp. CENA543]|uniref:glycosyltransferase family 8 protein n=1 Tax=Nostoc sp. CENA543 TaxID=1869241 RepID=UPI001CEF5992|nr:glycosyltransferase family 8 protein [Nostoc sp. CENA543]
MSHPQPIVLVCAADNNYAMPLTVTVRSALANLKSDRLIALFILDGDISQPNKRKIIQSLDSQRVDIAWIRFDDALFANLTLERHLTIPAYYRLLLAQVLPREFSKAIYLDSDMVVTGNLDELWNIEIGDNYVLAVQDDVQLYISMCAALQNYQELGISPHSKYFNSGLLVINLDKWRSDDIGSKVVEYLRQNQQYQPNDQDGLNAILADKWGELHPKWNQMPRIYDDSFRKDTHLPEEIYQEVLHHPSIIHFTNTPKPWYAGIRTECQHPKKDLFFHYLDMTAWSGWRDTIWRRLGRKFLKLALVNSSKL